MKTLFFLLCICAPWLASAQIHETVKSRGVENQISNVNAGMYQDSESEAAREHFSKGTQMLENNDLKGAEKELLKAIEADPKYVEAYDNLGITYRKLGEYDKSIETYKKSIKLFPKGLTAHQNLAVVYAIKQDYVNAVNQYTEMSLIEPENPEAYFGLANAYMVQKSYKEALKNAYKALDLYQKAGSSLEHDVNYMLGMIYYYMMDKPNAAKYIAKARDGGVKVHQDLLDKLGIQ